MGAPAIKSAAFLKNNGVRVLYVGENAQRTRYEPPNGSLSMHEAAALLGTYPLMMYQLKTLGRLKTRRVRGRFRVPVVECHRIRKLWRGKSPTVKIGVPRG